MAIAYLTSAVTGSDLTTYTFGSVSFGDAAADRHIIAFVSGQGSGGRTVSSVTIGGVSATLVAANSVGDVCGSLAIAAVPTGTTGDIVVTFSGAMVRAGCAAWRATELSSATPSDTAIPTASEAHLSGTIDAPASGFIIAAAINSQGRTSTISGVTERFDQAHEAGGSQQAGGDAEFPDGVTGQTITFTLNITTGTNTAGSYASWGSDTATPQAVEGTINPTGALTIKPGKAVSGSLAPAGTLTVAKIKGKWFYTARNNDFAFVAKRDEDWAYTAKANDFTFKA